MQEQRTKIWSLSLGVITEEWVETGSITEKKYILLMYRLISLVDLLYYRPDELLKSNTTFLLIKSEKKSSQMNFSLLRITQVSFSRTVKRMFDNSPSFNVFIN